MTKEQLNWREVKDNATHLSTTLVKKFGLKEGETVALFSQNVRRLVLGNKNSC